MPTKFAAVLVTLPDNTRPPLSSSELEALASEGIPLCVNDRVVGKCPPDGVIRQGKSDWWWHPSEAHAEAAAKARGERAFIVGTGLNREIAARS